MILDNEETFEAKTRPSVFVLAAREDEGISTWLSGALKRCLRPPFGRAGLIATAVPAQLPTGSDLVSWMDETVRENDWLVVIASPAAAKSRIVRAILLRWWSRRGNSDVLLVLCGGSLAWDSSRNQFDWTRSDALPKVLGKRPDGSLITVDQLFDVEPAWLDLQDFLGQLTKSLTDQVLKRKMESLVARIRNVELDALRRDHRVQQRKLFSFLSILAAVPILVMSWKYNSSAGMLEGAQEVFQTVQAELGDQTELLNSVQAERERADMLVSEGNTQIKLERKAIEHLTAEAYRTRDLIAFEQLNQGLDMARGQLDANPFESPFSVLSKERARFLKLGESPLPVDLTLWERRFDRITEALFLYWPKEYFTAKGASKDGRFVVGESDANGIPWRLDLLRGSRTVAEPGASMLGLLQEVGAEPWKPIGKQLIIADPIDQTQVAAFDALPGSSSIRKQFPGLGKQRGIAQWGWTNDTIFANIRVGISTGIAFDAQSGALIDLPYLDGEMHPLEAALLFTNINGARLYVRDRSPFREVPLKPSQANGAVSLLSGGDLIRLADGSFLDLVTHADLGLTDFSDSPLDQPVLKDGPSDEFWILGSGGEVVRRNLSTGQDQVLRIPELKVSAMAPTPDGLWLCISSQAGELGLLEIASGDYHQLAKGIHSVSALHVTPLNDTAIVEVRTDKGIVLLQLALDRGELTELPGLQDSAFDRVYFSHGSGQALVVFNDQQRVPTLVDFIGGQPLRKLMRLDGRRITAAHFSENGEYVFLGFEGGGFGLWNVPFGMPAWEWAHSASGDICQIMTAKGEDFIVFRIAEPPSLLVLDQSDIRRESQYLGDFSAATLVRAGDPPSPIHLASLALRLVRMQHFVYAEKMAGLAVEDDAAEANLTLAWTALAAGDRAESKRHLELAIPALNGDAHTTAILLRAILSSPH